MNKYDVEGIVGEGAYGVVLKCRNKVRVQRNCALWPRGEAGRAHGFCKTVIAFAAATLL